MTERRRRGLYIALGLEVLAFALFGLVMLDVATHRHDDPYVINQFGYRGPARASKRPAERRAVIVGGTAAFGSGLPWPETVGPQLALAIDKLKGTPGDAPFLDIQNIAEPSAGADTYIAALQDYAYLQPDLVVIYDGYDPIGRRQHGRRESFLFRSFGYLPLVLARRLESPTLESSIDPRLSDHSAQTGGNSCADTFASYCRAMVGAVEFALTNGRAVIVVTPPYVSTGHERQQKSLATELTVRFGSTPGFRYVDLGRAVDLHDKTQSPDGVQTTLEGNRAIAQALARPIVDLFDHR